MLGSGLISPLERDETRIPLAMFSQIKNEISKLMTLLAEQDKLFQSNYQMGMPAKRQCLSYESDGHGGNTPDQQRMLLTSGMTTPQHGSTLASNNDWINAAVGSSQQQLQLPNRSNGHLPAYPALPLLSSPNQPDTLVSNDGQISATVGSSQQQLYLPNKSNGHLPAYPALPLLNLPNQPNTQQSIGDQITAAVDLLQLRQSSRTNGHLPPYQPLLLPNSLNQPDTLVSNDDQINTTVGSSQQQLHLPNRSNRHLTGMPTNRQRLIYESDRDDGNLTNRQPVTDALTTSNHSNTVVNDDDWLNELVNTSHQ